MDIVSCRYTNIISSFYPSKMLIEGKGEKKKGQIPPIWGQTYS